MSPTSAVTADDAPKDAGRAKPSSAPLPTMKAGRIAIIYALLGSLWILFSDNVADMFFSHSPHTLLLVSTAKGWFYVLFTSFLLYVTIRHYELQNQTTIKHLSESETRFKTLFEDHGSVMLIVEPISGRIVNANEAAAKFYQYDRNDLIGMSVHHINALRPEEQEIERQRATSQEQNYFVFPHRLASGEIRTVEVYAYPIMLDDSKYLFSIVHDISERNRVQLALESERHKLHAALDQVKTCREEIERLSSVDTLTGLWNRRHFREIGQAEVYRAKTYRHPLCLLLMDFDGFGRVNEELGQLAGDRVLSHFAEVYTSMLRHQDVAACLNGDEFAVLLPQTPMAEAILLADRLRQAAETLSVPSSLGPYVPNLTLSLGVASFQDNATDFDSFLHVASDALAEAKRLGGNRLVSKA